MVYQEVDRFLEQARLEVLAARNEDGNTAAFNLLCDAVNDLRRAIEVLTREAGR